MFPVAFILFKTLLGGSLCLVEPFSGFVHTQRLLVALRFQCQALLPGVTDFSKQFIEGLFAYLQQLHHTLLTGIQRLDDLAGSQQVDAQSGQVTVAVSRRPVQLHNFIGRLLNTFFHLLNLLLGLLQGLVDGCHCLSARVHSLSCLLSCHQRVMVPPRVSTLYSSSR